MSPTRVSVVIPAHNASATIEAQLSALERQATDQQFEVIVVDNASTDRTGDRVASYFGRIPGLRLLQADDGAGPGYARNVGARAASGELLLFCDADDEVHEEWLSSLVAALGKADMVGGAIEVMQLNSDAARAGYPNLSNNLQTWRSGTGFASSCNMGVSKRVFDQLGGFDATLRAGEDGDLSIRCILAGFRLTFAPDAIVYYRCRPTVRAAARQFFQYGKAEVLLSEKYAETGPALSVRHELRMLFHHLVRWPKLLYVNRRIRWAREFSMHSGRLASVIELRLKRNLSWRERRDVSR